MAKKLLPASIAAFVVLILTLALSLGTATAHEPRDIEDYNLVVGFVYEPAFEGIMNGVYLSVTKVAEHGHGDSSSDHHATTEASSAIESEDTADSGHSHGAELIEGVTGLEQTIIVEVTHIPSGAKRNMTLHAFDEPGNYKADFIPTASGQYAFHFIGTIEGMLLDERFESGVGTFDDVQPATAIQFPERAASTRELESAVRGALESARQAQDTALALEAAAESANDSASTATTLAIAGIAVGAIGIIIGGIGITAALRRKD